jgi:hypothetical protein
MKASATGIADFICAVETLRPDPAAMSVIAEMCGMSLVPEVTAPQSQQPVQPSTDKEDVGKATPSPATATSQTLPPSVRRLKPVRRGTVPTPQTNDPLSRSTTTVPSAARVFEGLLTVRDGAELLRLAASVPLATDKINVDRVVQELARARPIDELPRLHAPSLALGAQVLADVGQSMQPFFEDQEELLQRFAGSLREHVEIRYFADDPQLGAGPHRRTGSWKPYVPPDIGASVIALTDLGCGFPERPDAARAWLRMAQYLRRRQSRIVVFAPVRLSRIPLALRRVVELVLWDRSSVRRNVMQLAGRPGE